MTIYLIMRVDDSQCGGIPYSAHRTAEAARTALNSMLADPAFKIPYRDREIDPSNFDWGVESVEMAD